MATREEVAQARADTGRLRRLSGRWIGADFFGAALAIGFLALAAELMNRFEIAR